MNTNKITYTSTLLKYKINILICTSCRFILKKKISINNYRFIIEFIIQIGKRKLLLSIFIFIN